MVEDLRRLGGEAGVIAGLALGWLLLGVLVVWPSAGLSFAAEFNPNKILPFVHRHEVMFWAVNILGGLLAAVMSIILYLAVGDRFTNDDGEWEIASRPVTFKQSHEVRAHIQRPGNPATAKETSFAISFNAFWNDGMSVALTRPVPHLSPKAGGSYTCTVMNVRTSFCPRDVTRTTSSLAHQPSSPSTTPIFQDSVRTACCAATVEPPELGDVTRRASRKHPPTVAIGTSFSRPP